LNMVDLLLWSNYPWESRGKNFETVVGRSRDCIVNRIFCPR